MKPLQMLALPPKTVNAKILSFSSCCLQQSGTMTQIDWVTPRSKRLASLLTLINFTNPCHIGNNALKTNPVYNDSGHLIYLVNAVDFQRPSDFNCWDEKLSLNPRQHPPMRRLCGVYKSGFKPKLTMQLRSILLN